MKIKICGITTLEEAKCAEELGVDMIGFVFHPSSKRNVEPSLVRGIAQELPYSLMKVGVFVDRDRNDVLNIARAARLDMMQFHGDETEEYCAFFKRAFRIIKAFRVSDEASIGKIKNYPVDYYLLDTFVDGLSGGTGKTFDTNILKKVKFDRPFILSGGLTADNVRQAIRNTKPFGVDVSSGVERPEGGKDLELMKRFVEAVRKGSKDDTR